MSKHKFERNPYKLEPGEYRLIKVTDLEDGYAAYVSIVVCLCGKGSIVGNIKSDAPEPLVRRVTLVEYLEGDLELDDKGRLVCPKCNAKSNIVDEAYKAIYGEE